MRRLIFGLLVAGAMFGPAAAQTPPSYTNPGGVNVPTPPASIMGIDSITGARCFSGISMSCRITVLATVDSNAQLPASLGPKAPSASLSVTYPLGTTSTPTAGTVAVAGTYQTVMTANASRRGCMLQNKSAGVLRVYQGAAASATDAAAWDLAPGGVFNCAGPGTDVTPDEIAVTSATPSAAFVWTVQ